MPLGVNELHHHHHTQDLSGGEWTRVIDSTQPIVEIEVAIMGNAAAMLSARDEEGFVHTRMGDSVSSSP
jgi:hypothetical protein